MSIETPRRTQALAMSNRTFDILRQIAQLWLPALSALYFGLSQVWGLPFTEEIVGSIAVVDVFLGTILGLSRTKYQKASPAYDGELVLETRPDPQADLYSLELSTPLRDLPEKHEVTLKIHKQDLAE